MSKELISIYVCIEFIGLSLAGIGSRLIYHNAVLFLPHTVYAVGIIIALAVPAIIFLDQLDAQDNQKGGQ